MVQPAARPRSERLGLVFAPFGWRRQADAVSHAQRRDAALPFGNWIDAKGATSPLIGKDITLEPLETARIAERDVPVRWRVRIESRGVNIETRPLNPESWMATEPAYWEGPIRFTGTHKGEGYLEMTGY
jgi:predicted secreted hydrolase